MVVRMSIDKKDTEKVGKLVIPFVLAIFLALALEDMYDSLPLEHRILTLGLLIFAILLIYRKKVWKILQ
jgi:undecaprenyl pyrophosphate phosphatase UppP